MEGVRRKVDMETERDERQYKSGLNGNKSFRLHMKSPSTITFRRVKDDISVSPHIFPVN